MKTRFQSVLILVAAACLAVPALGSTSKTTADLHLLRPGNAVADLDGDHIPDIVSGIETGHSALGYSYRVDLDLSGRSDSPTFTVLSDEPAGLNIEAIDIDGDQDLDLVITSRLRHRLVGVWINDGEGHFTKDDPAKYAPTLVHSCVSVKAPDSPAPRFSNIQKRRALAITQDPALLSRPPSKTTGPPASPHLPFHLTLSARLRAPPISQ